MSAVAPCTVNDNFICEQDQSCVSFCVAGAIFCEVGR